MIIIKKDAEVRAMMALEKINQQGSDKRCVFIELSKVARRQNIKDSVLAELICKEIPDDRSNIYFCADGDVVVLATWLPVECFEHLSKKLHEFFQMDMSVEFTDMFEVKQSYERIMMKLRRKNTYGAVPKVTEVKQKSLQDVEEALANAKNNETFDTVEQRREGRVEAEIMIVDDDEFSARLVKNSLKKDYHVTAAVDGISGLNTYGATAPNVIFLDIGLPDVTGHDVLKAILERDPGAYVVMLSGNADRDNVMSAIQSGAKGFVAKPFTREKLLSYIHQCPTIQ